mmetsp:Transcript_14686/g.21937  ORF Transcript_14686/g.21937 Transcript_14686/m.21937 type:complete len:141 (+) Transcript_14686:349-771(+)
MAVVNDHWVATGDSDGRIMLWCQAPSQQQPNAPKARAQLVCPVAATHKAFKWAKHKGSISTLLCLKQQQHPTSPIIAPDSVPLTASDLSSTCSLSSSSLVTDAKCPHTSDVQMLRLWAGGIDASITVFSHGDAYSRLDAE